MDVFPDTGALLAMLVFPRDQFRKPTLAGEVSMLLQAGQFNLILGRSVVDELDEVLWDRFPAQRTQALTWLKPFADAFTRRPTPAEIEAVMPACTDPFDAPIFASAIIAKPDIVLSNDFRAFHTPAAKAFWQAHEMRVESLYGLLCTFGLRQRKD